MSGVDAKDEWVARTLGFSFGKPGEAANASGGGKAVVPRRGETDELGLELGDYWKAALTLFGMANRQVQAQLKQLGQALERHGDHDLKEIAKNLLPHVGARGRDSLVSLLEGTLSNPDTLEHAAGEIVDVARQFLDTLDDDPQVQACDDNPFKTNVTVFETYRTACLGIILVAQSAAR